MQERAGRPGNYMARSRQDRLSEVGWGEVLHINTYVVFVAYLSMAIKGLAFLMLTWTTVVLLGGFVGTLHTKDFWCLTFIAFIQAAGIVDSDVYIKLSYAPHSLFGLIMSIFAGFRLGDDDSDQSLASCIARFLAACILVIVQVLVFFALLYSVAIPIYRLGIPICGGISLWRLIEHNYGGNDLNENLVPAMDTLYFLAVLQCFLYCYRDIFSRIGQRIAKTVATGSSATELNSVTAYMIEMWFKCNKDLSFTDGTNLITKAVEKIGSNSPDVYLSGVETLHTAICIGERQLEEEDTDDYPELSGRRLLMKHIVLSASSAHILQRLLETLDSRGIHERETRSHAAKIVEYLALSIDLEQFPRGVHHVSSLIDTFEEYVMAEPYDRDCLYDQYEQSWKLQVSPGSFQLSSPDGELWKAYKELLLQGMCILRKLAADGNNCRVMTDTRDLVSKITAPVTSDLIHHTTDDHGAWSDIVEASMEVMTRLTNAPQEVGAKLRREIASSQGTVSTLWRILNCDKCNHKLKVSAIRILKDLYMDTESSKAAVLRKESRSSREDFVRKLVDIFTQEEEEEDDEEEGEEEEHNWSISIRQWAGITLSEICFRGGSSDATVVIQKSGDVVDSLTKILVHDEDEACVQAAAEILEHLCTHYTDADEYLVKLKNATTDAMPKMIEKIINYGANTGTGKDEFTKPETDIESQSCNGRGKGISSSSSSHLQNNGDSRAVVQSARMVTLLSSLLSLCGTVIINFCPDFDASSFLNKLRKIEVAKNLSLSKAITELVISLMKRSGGKPINQQELKFWVDGLSRASRNMLDLDYSMVFSSADTATTSSKLNKCTLASLVKEAQEVHAKCSKKYI